MKHFLIIFTFFFSQTIFSQGIIDGFYRGKGNATTVLGFGLEDFNEYLGGKNETGLSREGQYINLFASYGILEHLDIQASLPYLEVAENKNLQDISLFLKHRFYKKENRKLELNIGLGFSTPVSDYKINGLNDIGQQATIIDFRFMPHYHFKKNWFATLQTGFSYKFNETPNSIPFAAKISKASKHWYFDVYYDFQYAIDGADYRGTPPPKSFKELGVSYNKLGATLYKPFTQAFGMYLGMSHIISGRNTFLGNTYAFGLVYNYKRQNLKHE